MERHTGFSVRSTRSIGLCLAMTSAVIQSHTTSSVRPTERDTEIDTLLRDIMADIFMKELLSYTWCETQLSGPRDIFRET